MVGYLLKSRVKITCSLTGSSSYPLISRIGLMRNFKTGATRDSEHHKNDYEGFLSPLVIESFGNYMDKHRIQKDGSLRASDNWQLGIPQDVYMKSMWRHFLDVWKIHRGHQVEKDGHIWNLEEALNALLFNVMGMQHEELRRNSNGK